jgi:hypothetical protein
MKVVFVAQGLEVTPELRSHLLTRLRLALPHGAPAPRRATVYLWDGARTSRGATQPVRRVCTPAGPVLVKLAVHAPRIHCLVSLSLDGNRLLSAQGSGASATSAAHRAAVRLAEAADRASGGGGGAPLGPPRGLVA